MTTRFFPLLLLSAIIWAKNSSAEDKPKGGPPAFQDLKYRSIGPSAGGRVCRSAGIPGNPLVYYAATASGGVWKSTDAGVHWNPIFDDKPVSSIGSLAIAPSDPNVIYIGTGEGNIRGNVAQGNGIWKSTDAGKTWQHVWNQLGQIGTLIVHPTNPDIAFAAVLGHAFGPNSERGIYRTTDGGKSWKQVLAKNRDTGASDVCFDPSNPRILFAGLWQARRKPWVFTSGGPGSGLYMSRDGGDTWKQLGGSGVAKDDLKGLPEGIYGKIAVAVAPSDSQRVYALIEAEKGGLYRSDNGGESWALVNGGHYLRQRAWYFTTLTVDPRSADVVWCPTVPLLKSIDGGKTFKKIKGTHHGDHHDLWIDPRNPLRMIDSNDGGVDISADGGKTWYAPPLPICQFYHINVDNSVPYRVMGNMQDLGTASGPSNSRNSGGITLCDWYTVGGGETGFAVPDPTDANIVYAGEYGGTITRFDFRTRQAHNVSIYPTNPSGHGAGDLRYRFQWTAPILVSRWDPKTVYHAGNVLFQTTDAGVHWKPISPDLTRNDKNKQRASGGPITGDNTGAEYYCTIFALAESPVQKGVMWAGSDDGLVHVSKDAGKTWTNVTEGITGLPEWSTISCIEASPNAAGTAYVVADAHRLDDNRPYLYRTTDFGKTWKTLAAKLPADNYLHAVRADPKRKGLLFLATERGVWFSQDEGGAWEHLKLNLPTVGVTDLQIKDNDLVVGTNGRSVWIFDDLTPIREMSPKIAAGESHLFPEQPAVRWRYHSPVFTPSGKTAGANPPKGAIVNYWLKAKPKDPITLEILDAKGERVTLLTSKKDEADIPEDDPDASSDAYKKPVLPVKPGVNRVAWDLRYEGATVIKGAKFDGGNPREGPLVLPGTYTLKLTVAGKVQTTTVEVKADPRVKLVPAVLEEQLKTALAIRGDINQITAMVTAIRAIRTQLKDRAALLTGMAKAGPLIKQSGVVVGKLDALEAKLHNPKAEVSYDILAQPGGAQLFSLLISLFGTIHESDGPVTQGMQEVYAEQKKDLQKLSAEYQALLGELDKLNAAGKELQIPGVIVPGK